MARGVRSASIVSRSRRIPVSLRPSTRFSRPLVLQLKAAETALKKAAAIAAKMAKGVAAARTTPGVRDLAAWLGRAGDAVK